ncbi:MAG: methyltransferase [Rhodobacteraceae bacterium]|nr:methyltransferase [Paracoccaceae bacterium]
MSVRLTLALSSGLSVPDTGRVLVLHPTAGSDLTDLPKDRVLILQPQRPDFEVFSAQGFECVAELPSEDSFAMAIVFVTRAKALSRDLIARAAAVTDGPVIVDGAKTDGIDSIVKDLRKTVDLSAPIAKAHGKICWFSTPADLGSWRAPEFTETDGFVTAPGVFSADGIDPASRLLAEALSEKLGSRVADLGAGWGYLSAQVLGRETVQSLHLVEADHAALRCARRNVTDPRAQFHWADATNWAAPEVLDCVVMNPPFHTTRAAEPSLGQAFIATAARALTGSGQLWLVANRHLPYEVTLSERFAKVEEVAGDNRFKVLHAIRPKRNRR